MANEVLNKMAVREALRRPSCRVKSINWGPWDGGMVTPGLKSLFEQEGVGVIPLQAGAEFLLDELSADQDPVEVMVLAPPTAPTPAAPRRPVPAVNLPVAFERRLDLGRVSRFGSARSSMAVRYCRWRS